MNKQPQSTPFRTTIGGQALMEGILMRGPSKQAIVCRTADGLVEKVEEKQYVLFLMVYGVKNILC